MIPPTFSKASVSLSGRCFLALAVAVGSLALQACKFMQGSQVKNEPLSEVDAIHAMSNNLFGKNVRAYMWGLTTSNLDEFKFLVAMQKRQAGGVTLGTESHSSPSSVGSQTRIVQRSGQVMSLQDPPPQQQGVGTIEATSKRFYQCWYIATTESSMGKVEGADLVRLFLERGRPVASTFVDAEFILNELQKDEQTRRTVAFAANVMPTLGCGSVGLISGWKQAAFGALMCNLAFSAYNNYNLLRNSDVTWGSAAAQDQIQKEIKRKVDELENVNWDVLDSIQRKVNAFDSDPELALRRTPVECPRPSQALVKDMGTSNNNTQQ
jgi:hypothetical protein